jgi:hypothetical protein
MKPRKKHGRVFIPIHGTHLQTHASFVNQEVADFHLSGSILV